MSNWDILGIPATNDIALVKKAYSEKSKIFHPETHPEEFQQLHKAYRSIVTSLLRGANINTSSNNDIARDFSNDTQNRIKVNIINEVPKKKTAAEILDDIKTEASLEQQQIQQELEAKEKAKIAALETAKQLLEDEAFLSMIDNVTKQKEAETRKRFRLEEFEKMLQSKHYPDDWKAFFTRDEFLDNQYNPDYIKAIAQAFDARIKQPVNDVVDTVGRCPQYAFIYMVIAYGCMFSTVGTVPVSENVYKLELMEPLQKAFRLYDSMFLSYVLVEKEVNLLGERFAFYVYRNILELLEKSKPDEDELCQWIAWGMAKENHTHILDICHYSPSNGKRISPEATRFHDIIKRSPLIFELLSYLLDKPSTPPIFKKVLREVCEAYMKNLYCCEEIRILYLMTEE